MAAGKVQKNGSHFPHEDEACSSCTRLGDEKGRRSKGRLQQCNVLDGKYLDCVRVNRQDFSEC